MKLQALIRAGVMIALLASATAPLAAQRTGSRLGKNAAPKDAAAAMRVMVDCVVSRRPDLVQKLFETLPGSTEEYRLLKISEADLGLCMDNQMLVLDGKELAFPAGQMRYSLAEAWVRASRSRLPLVSPATALAPVWFELRLAAVTPTTPLDRGALVLQDFGHCVAVSEWAGTRELLVSKPASAEQSAAIAKLVPKLGACLTQDAKVAVTPENLRRVLAEPVYHIVAASPAAPLAQ